MGSSAAVKRAGAKANAVHAGAIPLWEAAAGGRAEDLNAHQDTRTREKKGKRSRKRPAPRKRTLERQSKQERLEFGVGVRTDFAVQVDFFVLRRDPFHEVRSLRRGDYAKSIARSGLRSIGNFV